MNKRIALALASGVVAGATVVGVPAFAYATSDSDGGTSAPDMSSMMSDPEFRDSAKAFMSEMMSDPQLREQMRSMMGDMQDMDHMGGSAGESNPGTP